MVIPDEGLWEEIKASVKPVKRQVKKDPPKRLRVVRGVSPNPKTFLDLHGLTVQQAFEAYVTFITKAYRAGYMTVMIITGRGTTGKSLIKNEFENWLEHPKIKSHIRSYQWQNRGGAVKIHLKKKASEH